MKYPERNPPIGVIGLVMGRIRLPLARSKKLRYPVVQSLGVDGMEKNNNHTDVFRMLEVNKESTLVA
jgi:hypothetical protein